MQPRPLNNRSTIGIVAPSSPPRDPSVIKRSIKLLEKAGYRVKVGRSVYARNGFLAGSDQLRINDLHSFFKDKKVDGILCLRGGYGSARLLPKIDFKHIKKNPKFFCGYSDVTALHLAIFKKTGLITFHGPTLLSLFGKKSFSQFSFGSFKKAARGSSRTEDISKGYPAKLKVVPISKGKATGTLIGGNLAVLNSLIGTPWFPSLKGAILFLEDVNEPPYKVDRMLTQLLTSGALKGVKGIALGIWTGCEGEKKFSQSLIEIFKERLSPLKVPVCYGLPFGHIDDIATIPHGGKAELDAGKGILKLIG